MTKEKLQGDLEGYQKDILEKEQRIRELSQAVRDLEVNVVAIKGAVQQIEIYLNEILKEEAEVEAVAKQKNEPNRNSK